MAGSAGTVHGTTSSVRIRAVKPLAWAMAFLAAVVLFGLVDLGTLFGLANPAYEWPVPLEVSWGILFTFVIAGSYVWIALAPARSWPAVVQLGIAAAALAIGSAAGLDGRPVWVAVPVGGSAVLFAWLTAEAAGRFPRIWSINLPYLLLGAAGILLWLPYVLHALEMSRAGAEGDITWGIEHWPVQGAAGLALAACAAAMAFWVPGRPLLRLTVSLSATLVGAANLAYPERAGAMDGPLWGIAWVIWGTAVALPLPSPESGAQTGPAERTGWNGPARPNGP